MVFRVAVSACHGEVVHGGDCLDGVMEAVAPLGAVAEDLVVLYPGEVSPTRARTRGCSALSFSCPRRRGGPARLWCGTISPVPR